MASLESIPFELLEQILRLLPINSNLIELLVVCKSLHGCLTASITFAERHMAFQYPNATPTSFFTSLVLWHTLPAHYQAAFYVRLLQMDPTVFTLPVQSVLRVRQDAPRFRNHNIIRPSHAESSNMHVYAIRVACHSGLASVVKPLVETLRVTGREFLELVNAELRGACGRGFGKTAKVLKGLGARDLDALSVCANRGDWGLFFELSSVAVLEDELFMNRMFAIALSKKDAGIVSRLYELGCIHLMQHDTQDDSILVQVASLGIIKLEVALLSSDTSPSQLESALVAACSHGRDELIKVLLYEFTVELSPMVVSAAVRSKQATTVHLLLTDARFISLFDSNREIMYEAAHFGGKSVVETLVGDTRVSPSTKSTLVLLLALCHGKLVSPELMPTGVLDQVTEGEIENMLQEFEGLWDDFPRMLKNACSVNHRVLVSVLLDNSRESINTAVLEQILRYQFRDDQLQVTTLLLQSGATAFAVMDMRARRWADMFVFSCTETAEGLIARLLFWHPLVKFGPAETGRVSEGVSALLGAGREEFVKTMFEDARATHRGNEIRAAAKFPVVQASVEMVKWFMNHPVLNKEFFDSNILEHCALALVQKPWPQCVDVLMMLLQDPRAHVTELAFEYAIRSKNATVFAAFLHVDAERVPLATFTTTFSFFENGLYLAISESPDMIHVFLHEWLLLQNAGGAEHGRILQKALEYYLVFEVPLEKEVLAVFVLGPVEFHEAYALCVRTMDKSYQHVFEEDARFNFD
ncbi:hypothetical protein HDU98_001575, partial [Podochytrium sp. JEL0797]